MRFVIWSLGLSLSRFYFLQTLFLEQEQVIKKSTLLAYFRDLGKWNFDTRDRWFDNFLVRQPCQRTPPPPCKTLIEFPFDTKSSFPFLTPSPLPKDIAIQARCRCEACRSHQCAVLVAGCQNNSILTTERTFNRSTLIGRLCFRCRSRSIHKDNGNFLRVTEPGRPPWRHFVDFPVFSCIVSSYNCPSLSNSVPDCTWH